MKTAGDIAIIVITMCLVNIIANICMLEGELNKVDLIVSSIGPALYVAAGYMIARFWRK